MILGSLEQLIGDHGLIFLSLQTLIPLSKNGVNKKVFIYITHLHWDHFHGPTLRKIINKCTQNIKFIIPKTPEKRLLADLKSITSKKNIIELDHSKNIIYSMIFQFYHFNLVLSSQTQYFQYFQKILVY